MGARHPSLKVDQLTVDGLKTAGPVLIPASGATYNCDADNSGRLHVIPDMAANSTINLPAEEAGLSFEFMYVGGADDAHDHIITSGADANYFVGGVSFLDTDAGAGADEVHAGVYANGSSNSEINLNNLSAGSRIRFECDGTLWYVSGVIIADTVPTFDDQP